MTMPKKQTRATQLARQIQAVTGLPYTTCLKMCEPTEDSWGRLARALQAEGLTETADCLLAADAVTTEAGTWLDAGNEVEQLFDGTDHARVKRTYAACEEAAGAALSRAGFETYSDTPDAEAYHAAFLALSKAGALLDGRALARAALDIFVDDPMWCSDVIRTRGRAPFSYDTAVGLTGPETSVAVAARRAACAMARAAAVRFSGDEEWYEAAGIMVEAIWHASEAAGLPPLEGYPNCRDHLEHFMDGVIPNR
ncbi:hypothetical protein [Streptomyces vietnamensis]|uniref:Uncharacterized protein n=1 Tax=Streptomyces vietnamensis TaxID=362257 RepID=A0A0B5IPF4_9ACTN|nr:hypothetical protein [Streptomyces vietnamensis]AJF70299.1 hypothetical protein SVTN_39395 [Streptomyces vietnamensis]